MDSDDAGVACSRSLSERLAKQQIRSRILELPAKDPNELLVKEGVERFAEIVKEQLKEERKIILLPTTAANQKNESENKFETADAAQSSILPEVTAREMSRRLRIAATRCAGSRRRLIAGCALPSTSH